ncbi:helix-turn-helix domain-containing protein [Paenarthrobacter nitroguajacolicus]|uniref:helix-turn-helix domain-containing protein n=1 Tax=Paenarthrobacter nitroguajacolicus TaxID=211146 RepID=UPI003AEC0942
MQHLNAMAVAEVGDRLGITRASVHDLLDSGQLTASGRPGRQLLIDRSSVERLAVAGTRRGRVWTAKTAWAALALVSGLWSEPYLDQRFGEVPVEHSTA